MKRCPDCTTGYHLVHQDCRDPATGRRYSQNVNVPCDLCKGTCVISDEAFALRTEVREARAERHAAKRTLTAEAVRLGMARSELAAVEFGRADEALLDRWRALRKDKQ